jgi:hypothetical protein
VGPDFLAASLGNISSMSECAVVHPMDGVSPKTPLDTVNMRGKNIKGILKERSL